jgi:hypothetical protein
MTQREDNSYIHDHMDNISRNQRLKQREDNPFLNDNVTNRSINQNMSQRDFSENMKLDKGIPLNKGLQNMPFNFMESSTLNNNLGFSNKQINNDDQTHSDDGRLVSIPQTVNADDDTESGLQIVTASNSKS